MDSYSVDYNLLLSLFIWHPNFPRFSRWASFKLTYVSYWHPYVSWRILFFSGTMKCSFYTVLAPHLESAISSTSPKFFYLRMVFRNEDQDSRYGHCYCRMIFFYPLSIYSSEMWVYVCVCILLLWSLSTYLSVIIIYHLSIYHLC